MPSYRKNEARHWAWQHLKGCANVIIPSYTADLKGLNERGIRHDVRQCLAHGFTGTLLVSETALTLPEYAQFFEWSNDESKGRLKLILHAAFNTLEENIEAAKIAEANGCEFVLLSYPSNFYPESLDEIYDYTKAFCDATEARGVAVSPCRCGASRAFMPRTFRPRSSASCSTIARTSSRSRPKAACRRSWASSNAIAFSARR